MVRKRIVRKPQTLDHWVQAGDAPVDALPSIEAVPETQRRRRGRPAGGKSSDQGFQRTTLYLPEDLHMRLKLAAVKGKTEMSDLAIEAISKYLDELEI